MRRAPWKSSVGGALSAPAPALGAVAICALAVGLAVTLLTSCRGSTQMRIDVTTDVPCDAVRGASIAVGTLEQLESKTPSAWRASCEGGRIGALVVVPSGAKNQEVALRVVVGVNRASDECKPPDYGPGCIVARRALEFLPHTSLEVPVLMRHECEGIVCPYNQTCVKGGVCVSAHVPDPSSCATPEGCDETVLTPDGGAPDGPVNEGGTRDGGDGSITVTSKVSCGPYQACARRTDGRVFCWGSNDEGQLARDRDGGVANGFSTTPLQIPLGAPALDVAVGQTHACALVTNGDVLCWGANDFLQAGQPDAGAYVVAPSRVSGLAKVTDLHLGVFLSCARLAGGTLACWGDNSADEFANATAPAQAAAAFPAGVAGGVTQLSVGGRALCALRDGGAVECWGASGKGETSNPMFLSTPTVVSGIPAVRAIASGDAHGCVLSFDGRVFCWGASEDWALGPSIAPDAGPHPAPIQVALPTVGAIAAGQLRSCVTTVDAGVLCWGDGNGVPTVQDPSVASLGDFCIGLDFVCGRRADDAILCWGLNFAGQLGNGDTNPSAVATPVAFPP